MKPFVTPLLLAAPLFAASGGLALAQDAPQQSASTYASASNAYTPAPMPDEDINAPLQPGSHGTQLAPSLYQDKAIMRGNGYSYGASEQAIQNRAVDIAPIMAMKVPLN